MVLNKQQQNGCKRSSKILNNFSLSKAEVKKDALLIVWVGGDLANIYRYMVGGTVLWPLVKPLKTFFKTVLALINTTFYLLVVA